MKNLSLLAISLLLCTIVYAQNNDRWNIQDDGSIQWNINNNNIPHKDHVEMSGQMLSVVLRYGVDKEGAFQLNRSLVFPMLRLKPNNTHSSLIQRFETNIPALLTVENNQLTNEKYNTFRSMVR